MQGRRGVRMSDIAIKLTDEGIQRIKRNLPPSELASFESFLSLYHEQAKEIESQKEEIEGLHDALEMLPPKDVEIHERTQIKIKETVQELVVASLKDQIESLKATAELAVKALEHYTDDTQYCGRCDSITYFSENGKIARDALVEIKRISAEGVKP
jgi:hypothetical protein